MKLQDIFNDIKIRARIKNVIETYNINKNANNISSQSFNNIEPLRNSAPNIFHNSNNNTTISNDLSINQIKLKYGTNINKYETYLNKMKDKYFNQPKQEYLTNNKSNSLTNSNSYIKKSISNNNFLKTYKEDNKLKKSIPVPKLHIIKQKETEASNDTHQHLRDLNIGDFNYTCSSPNITSILNSSKRNYYKENIFKQKHEIFDKITPISKRISMLIKYKQKINSKVTQRNEYFNPKQSLSQSCINKCQIDMPMKQTIQEIFYPEKRNKQSKNYNMIESPRLLHHSSRPKINLPCYDSV